MVFEDVSQGVSPRNAAWAPMLVRYGLSGQQRARVGWLQTDALHQLGDLGPMHLSTLLRRHVQEVRAWQERLLRTSRRVQGDWRLLAPLDGGTEVWAAGVTYRRSEEARTRESATPDLYERVYDAERPELFFKANARRVAGPGEPVVIRSDSTWDVPEPELGVVVNCHGEILGYTVVNDVSSRSIEGQNALYLPQAKVYARCCALGPGIVPAWVCQDPYNLTLTLTIKRAGAVVWQGETTTAALRRRADELVAYLFREDTFPDGVVLSTGTGIVPEDSFSLQEEDVVEITLDQIGHLLNPVVRGKAHLPASPGRA